MGRIVVHINKRSWCWEATIDSVVARLSDEWEFVKIYKERVQNSVAKSIGEYDLFWSRGPLYFRNSANSANWIKALKAERRNIMTFSTGGQDLPEFVGANLKGCAQTEGVVCQNKVALPEARKFSDKVFLIPNGVEIDIFKPGEKPMVVGYAGRMKTPGEQKLKGIDLILRACDELGLELRTGSNERNKQIPHERMPDWYRSLDVYAQPSHSEGCSNSVMEAMATGLPCLICEGVGYHGEVCNGDIHDPKANVVFVERDLEDIKAKLEYLRDNPHIRERIGANARKFAEAHSWDIIAERFREMFRQVIAKIEADEEAGIFDWPESEPVQELAPNQPSRTGKKRRKRRRPRA